MRSATILFALLVLCAGVAGAQESRVRVNPYLGWYQFDESSFEKGFETSDVETDPVYGVRLAISGLGSWSLDLSYGRTEIAAEGTTVEGDLELASDATIQLLYGALNWHLPLTGPLDLFLSGNLAKGTFTAAYRVDSADPSAVQRFGSPVAPSDVMRWFSRSARAGVSVSHDQAASPITGVYDSFEIRP